MIMGIYAHEYLWSHHRAVLEELRRRGESHFKNRDERVKKKKEKLSIFHLSLNLSTHTHTVPQQIVLFELSASLVKNKTCEWKAAWCRERLHGFVDEKVAAPEIGKHSSSSLGPLGPCSLCLLRSRQWQAGTQGEGMNQSPSYPVSLC